MALALVSMFMIDRGIVAGASLRTARERNGGSWKRGMVEVGERIARDRRRESVRRPIVAKFCPLASGKAAIAPRRAAECGEGSKCIQ